MNIKTKTKAENLQLFEEARSLKEDVRLVLHHKAINGLEHKVNDPRVHHIDTKLHNKTHQD